MAFLASSEMALAAVALNASSVGKILICNVCNV
jgi:hypothetical protein